MSVASEISHEALRLGFSAVGFAPLGPCQHHECFTQWLASGYAAGMDYLHRHALLREDPRRLAPWANSVIVVAARYPAQAGPDCGFASYACGLDYHEVIRDRLVALNAFLTREHGVRHSRICVDSNPVSEREWAVRAGLGWIGRQGQLVNPRYGCCLFLGELLVDVDLPASEPLANRCGSCRQCLDACPTGAAIGDGCVDSRRCLSYLTIEHKGAISAALQPLLKGVIFGCDRCTACCPWNRFGEDAAWPEFHSSRPLPSAAECLEMDAASFRTRFEHTPVLRSGLERLQRNAALASAPAAD